MTLAAVKTEVATAILVKKDPSSPVFRVLAATEIAIKAGTIFAGLTFAEDTIVALPEGGLIVGADYAVRVDGDKVWIDRTTDIPAGDTLLGGFHFAPGGNADARRGGDEVPAINPRSLWDLNFRPSCADPRGMALVDKPGGVFWADIYLLCEEHLSGTSQFSKTIADGDNCPVNPEGGKPFGNCNYATACTVMKHHGKGVMSFEEFAAAAYGVTERTANSKNPKKTGLDAKRTSKFGLLQATGNMWVWGHDGDPDEPHASVFGGSWMDGANAGSRYAFVGYWGGNSSVSVGVRGRSDHLQLD